MDGIFSEYIKGIREMQNINKAPEMSYYYPLKRFLEKFAKKYLKIDIIVIQQMSHPFGKPDFTVLNNKEELIGIIECKKPNINLTTEENHKQKGKQIKRYRRETDNFIFMNFYDFKLYNNNKIKQKISLLNKNKKIKGTGESEIINLLTKFLSNTKSKYENKDFVIHGKGLTEKQINQLEDNRTIKITRNGYEFCMTKSASKIIKSDYVKSKFIEEKFIIGGQNLTEQQILHLEFYGWIVISRNGTQYLIE